MARAGRVVYKKPGGGAKGKARSKYDGDGDDEEYVVEEDEDVESESSFGSDAPSDDSSDEASFEFSESGVGSSEEDIEVARSKSRPRNRKKSRDTDSEFEDEDDDDEDFSPDEEDLEDEEASLVSKKKKKKVSRPRGKKSGSKASKPRGRKKRKKAAVPARKRRRITASSSDDDFILKDRVSIGRQQKRSKKTEKKTSLASKTRKKRSPVDSEWFDPDFVTSDDDFVKAPVVVKDQKKKRNNIRKTTVGSNTRRKKRSEVDSDSSDSDYVVSDDDFEVKDQVSVYKEQRKSEKVKRERAESKTTRKRSRLSVDSESSDFDDLILEEEIRDLRVVEFLNQEEPKRSFAGRKAEEKGKEKEADDLGKQVCGICLSEEQQGIVRGELNCCSHYFCFACIMEWSKVESRCPLCKRRFATITKSGRSVPGFGNGKACIRVQKRDQVYQPSEEELRVMLDPYENVVCVECQQGGDDSLMLLCDICDSSAHTYCVGLGREVPEGNWYCECCTSGGDGSSHSQADATMTEQGTRTSNSNSFSVDMERDGVTSRRANTTSSQFVSVPSRSSLPTFDLNASPRDFSGEGPGIASPVAGSIAATLSGRRAIQQRIRIILSSSRPGQAFASTTLPHQSTQRSTMTSESRGRAEALHVPEGLNLLDTVLGSEQWRQDSRPGFLSDARLAPCMRNEGRSFRHVDGAKEQVQSLVKSHLKNLSRDNPLGHSTFKDIVRSSTHTILAACGIEHRRSMISIAVEPPDGCPHYSDDAYLMKNCCSSCFSSFVKDVVLRVMNT